MEKGGGPSKRPQNNNRIHYSICQKATPDTISSKNIIKIRNKKPKYRDSNFNISRSLRKINISDRLLINNVSYSETQQESPSNNQFKRSEQLPYPKEIPLAKSSQSTPFLAKRGFSCKNRYFPGIFSHSSSQPLSKVSVNSLPKGGIPIYMSPVRFINGTTDLCKGNELVSFATKAGKYKSYCLPRRFLARQPRSNKIKSRCRQDDTISNETRLDHKHGQDFPGAISKHRIPRNKLGHISQYKSIAKSKDTLPRERSQQNTSNTKMELAVFKKTLRKTKFCLLCNTARKTSFQGNTEGSQHSTRKPSPQKIPDPGEGIPTMQVVDSESRKERHSFQLFRNYIHHIRRFRQRMGSTGKWKTYQRHLEHSPVSMAHKQKRIICCNSSPRFRERLDEEQKSRRSVRQSNCNSIHKKSRGNKITRADRTRLSTIEIGRSTKCNNMSSIHTRNIQRCCRQFIPTDASGGLASVTKNLQQDIPEVGHPRSRFVCIKQFESSPNLCFAGCKRQECSFHRCLQQDMGIQVSMDLPTPLTDSASASTSELCQRLLHLNSSTLGESILEVGSEIPSNRSSVSNTKLTSSPQRSINSYESIESPKPTFGGLEGTGWSLLTENWDDEDRNLILHAWRSSSLKTYRAPWNTWLARCKALGLNPNKPDAASVAQHLSFLFRVKKLSSSTVKLHKSVIATFADPILRNAITDSPIVKQIIKGIDLSKPPAGKKQIWDVKDLIKWMKNVTVQEENLFQISRHLALLLLLASGRRIHDLTLLKIDENSMAIDDSSVTFWPDFGSKTDNHLHRQSAWKLLQFPDEKLNPVRWIKLYMAASDSRRNANGNIINSLFVTSRGRVAPASKAIIAGWIKTAFSEININFSPGSIRAAVASSRKENNVPLDIIIRNGNWKSDKNVIRHYFKEIISTQSKDNTNDLDLVNTSFTTTV